eukprot:4485974-Amphidinium_carterae.1
MSGRCKAQRAHPQYKHGLQGPCSLEADKVNAHYLAIQTIGLDKVDHTMQQAKPPAFHLNRRVV